MQVPDPGLLVRFQGVRGEGHGEVPRGLRKVSSAGGDSAVNPFADGYLGLCSVPRVSAEQPEEACSTPKLPHSYLSVVLP